MGLKKAPLPPKNKKIKKKNKKTKDMVLGSEKYSSGAWL